MWIYEAVAREAFEAVKDLVEKYIVQLGGKQADANLPKCPGLHRGNPVSGAKN